MSATAAAVRPVHRPVTGDTGHTLRMTRWAPGARRRDVFRVMPDGALVELGHVTSIGGGLFMAYPAAEGHRLGGWRIGSFTAGARLLDSRIKVATLQVYTLEVLTETEGD